MRLLAWIPLIAAVLGLASCGKESISVPADDPTHAGAVLFSERCAGCHTIAAAGTQGSGNRGLRNQGPNFDQRKETAADVLFAIQNGGFSGAIMPQNIAVGDDAKQIAAFLEKWSGKSAKRPPRPGGQPTTGQQQQPGQTTP